jgi:hypothetical protein
LRRASQMMKPMPTTRMIKISRMPMPIAASSRDSAQTVPGPLVRRKNLSNVRSGIRVQWALSFIDTDEFHVLLVRLDGDVSREECELDFEAADTAGDGYIEFKEFMAWWTNWATQLWNTRLLRNPGLPTEQALRMARAILSPPLPEGSIAFA